MNEELSDLLEQMTAAAVSGIAQPVSPTTQDDVSTYDFARYEFVLNPFVDEPTLPSALTPPAIAYLEELESSGASVEILEYMGDLLLRLESSVRKGVRDGLPARRSPTGFHSFNDVPVLGSNLPALILADLYSLHRRLIQKVVDLDREIENFLTFHLYGDIRAKAQGMWVRATQLVAGSGASGYSRPLYDWVFFVETTNWWTIAPDLDIDPVDLRTDLEYPFDTYATGHVNVGIAIVYRQRWTALGAQPGEVVRTIPLGPGQSEKISTKVVRRSKTSTVTESMTETESSSRSNNATKDSAEVLKEATSNQNWSVSASASYGIGGLGFGASASGEMGGSSAKSSKSTTANLSETMKETASKLRQQTKVVVSTETESSVEESYSSEVRNANDEVPLTLQYHMLQTLYDVYTYLFAVQRVIFIPERLPAPYQIDVDWIRRHDWIIAAELRDESFRKTLNELIQDEDTEALIDYGDPNDPYSSMLRKTNEKFASFETPGTPGGHGGLDVADIYSQPQQQFDQYRRDEEARRRAIRLRAIQRKRLIQHIRDNALHYCRAIWAREDAEQRMLRYRREGRTVPYLWTSAMTGPGVDTFVPSGAHVALDDVVQDITPIGFTGNYVAFRLAPMSDAARDTATIDVTSNTGEIQISLNDVLDVFCARYTDATGTEIRDPAIDLFLEEASTLPGGALATASDNVVRDLVSYIPSASDGLIDGNGVRRNTNGTLINPITVELWAEYQLRKNATRRFLVDSDNLYISLLLGDGIALEPFKRAHRVIDVLRAIEARRADELKNKRREVLQADVHLFDPDIEKVVVTGSVSPESLAGGLIQGDPRNNDDRDT